LGDVVLQQAQQALPVPRVSRPRASDAQSHVDQGPGQTGALLPVANSSFAFLRAQSPAQLGTHLTPPPYRSTQAAVLQPAAHASVCDPGAGPVGSGLIELSCFQRAGAAPVGALAGTGYGRGTGRADETRATRCDSHGQARGAS